MRRVLLSFLLISFCCAAQPKAKVAGDLKLWHKLTITFDGPSTAEDATPNPFTDYRLNVVFTHAKTGRNYVVPGYFAADGNAANTSATAGNQWRAHFTPDETGEWRYKASFRAGPGVAAVLAADAGKPAAFDGASGTFRVANAPANAPGFYGKGLLRYVGEHYLQHAANKEYFLKGGADSPENFLAYADFDGTFDTGTHFSAGTNPASKSFVHVYEPHARDYRPGDPTWRNGKGKNIIGALNYLGAKGINSVYFLTYNIDGGDGKDTWMWTSPDARDRYDCSKLEQWEIVFTHMDRLGIQLHVVTQETENDRKLGGGPGLNPIRNVYYRELVARFAHHLAVIWNQGEENNASDADRKEISRYIRALDPYNHPITVHTHNNKAPDFYNGLLGDAFFEATSIQGAMESYNRDAIALRERSARAGRKWAVFGDEQPPSHTGVMPDESDPDHDAPRAQALWGNLMGGGSGVEWYFGYKYPHMDLNCEDWRSRERLWDQTRHALSFFREHLPFWRMAPDNALADARDARVLAQPGRIYAVYLPAGGRTSLKLESGSYRVRWFNPRTGGALDGGSVRTVTGPGAVSLGEAPADPDKDWAVLVERAQR
jgi:hypothetical protein